MSLKETLKELDIEDLLNLIPTTVESARTKYYSFLDGGGYSCDCAFGHFQGGYFKDLLIEIILHIDRESKTILEKYNVRKESCRYSLCRKTLLPYSDLDLPHEKLKCKKECAD